MERTAVEWLEEKITKNDCGDLPMYIYNFIEQAQEMEEAQRKNDFKAGNECACMEHENIEDYFNKYIKSE